MGELMRGKVTAYPDDNKGLVEVELGECPQDGDKLLARVEPNVPGLYWLPEIGDVVDLEVPGVPGYEAHILHIHRQSGDGQTSSCWTENNDKKQLKSRSGHTVTLDDTKDNTSLTVHTAGGLELRLDDKQKQVTVKPESSETPSLTLEADGEKDAATLKAGKKISLQCGGAEIKIDSSGNITISTSGKLSVSAQTIELTAKGNLTAKGQQAELKGNLTATVNGQTGLELTSSGITKVKGSMVKLN